MMARSGRKRHVATFISNPQRGMEYAGSPTLAVPCAMRALLGLSMVAELTMLFAMRAPYTPKPRNELHDLA